jgi:hypothetical protein
MASKDDLCHCGHERSLHVGNARKLLDRKGCAVTFCHCPGFHLEQVVVGG